MAELTAQGRKPNDKWRQVLPPGESVILGRNSPKWSVPWEPFLSRSHARLTFKSGGLEIEQLEAARNSIFFDGKASKQFHLTSGQYFVIGRTIFEFIDELAATEAASGVVVQQQAFSTRE